MPWSKASISPAAMRVLKALIGYPPQTMTDLVRETGVTRTAIAEQLQDLMQSGYVKRQTERGGRGRPRHLYEATDMALSRLFSKNQQLGPLLFRSLLDIGGPPLVRELIDRVSKQLADHYSHRIQSTQPVQRMGEMAALLRQEGVLVEFQQEKSDSGSRAQLTQLSCPYIDMVDDDLSVCRMEQQMFCNVVGCDVQMTECRCNGCSSCRFEVVERTDGGDGTGSSAT